MITASVFRDRCYAVLGLARSGEATVRSLAASGARVIAWDSREAMRDSLSDIAEIADPMEYDLSGCEAIIVSPGVPLNRHPIAQRARDCDVDVIGDIELFARARGELPRHKIVAITGTNGKSTTTALVEHILKSAGVPALMGGNIGLPILGQDPLPEGGVYVLELSSYQIDLCRTLDADVAVLLNLTPDHLDRYAGFEGYRVSKARLFSMQSPEHLAIFGDGDDTTREICAQEVERRGEAHVQRLDRVIDGQEEWPALQGPHNMQNVQAAVAAVEALGITQSFWRPALKSFGGLTHRMERVGERNGVLFVNDSKATNPASTAPALAAYSNVHWIVGGLAKTDNLDECADNFDHVKRAYTIGEAGLLFSGLLEPHMDVEPCEMLSEAVRRAADRAVPGDVILLSPAAASFDQFTDFEARGDAFRASVQALGDVSTFPRGQKGADKVVR